MSLPCPKCGHWTLHRSHSRNAIERALRSAIPYRPYRCTGCSWRGWLHRSSGKSKAPLIKNLLFFIFVLIIAIWVSLSLWNNIK